MYGMYDYTCIVSHVKVQNEMQLGQAAYPEASWGLWQVLGQNPTSQLWLQQQLQQLLLQEF